MNRILDCLLSKTSDSDVRDFYFSFQKIPLVLISKYSSDFSDIFEPILKKYCEILVNDNSIGLQFSDIDNISDSLKLIFVNTRSTDVKVVVLKTIAELATNYNRYYAMDLLKDLVKGLSDAKEIQAVSALISSNPDIFNILDKASVAHNDILLQAYISISKDQQADNLDFLF